MYYYFPNNTLFQNQGFKIRKITRASLPRNLEECAQHGRMPSRLNSPGVFHITNALWWPMIIKGQKVTNDLFGKFHVKNKETCTIQRTYRVLESHQFQRIINLIIVYPKHNCIKANLSHRKQRM